MKTINLLAIAAFAFAACTPSPKNNPEGIILDLEITGLPDSTEMQISLGATMQQEEPIQSAWLVDGKARFAFDVEGPRMYTVTAANTYGVMNVVMDKGHVATLAAEAVREDRPDLDRPLYSYKDQQVTGTSLQDEFLRRRVDREPLNKMYDEYHSLTDTAALRVAEKRFFEKVDSTFKAAFRANADSWWGPMLVLYSYSYVTEENAEEYDYFTDEVKESFYGRILHDRIWPPTMVGLQMPDFSFTNQADGKQMTLKQALEGKKYLLLDFWASWCRPCRKEIPNIVNLYRQYHAQGFEVVSISADTDAAAWEKALDEEKLPWLNDRDGEQGICQLYKVQYYPTIYLLDSEGKVVAKDIRGEELAAKLKELFD